jgi:hypothetical protein
MVRRVVGRATLIDDQNHSIFHAKLHVTVTISSETSACGACISNAYTGKLMAYTYDRSLTSLEAPDI